MHVDVAKSHQILLWQGRSSVWCRVTVPLHWLSLCLFICFMYLFIYWFIQPRMAEAAAHSTPVAQCQQLILASHSEKRKKKKHWNAPKASFKGCSSKNNFLGKCRNHWIYPVFLLLISHIQCQALFWFFFAVETEKFVHLFNASRVFFVSPPLCAPVGDTHRRVLRCVSEHALLFPFTHSKSLHL